jgi:hypothetical protein
MRPIDERTYSLRLYMTPKAIEVSQVWKRILGCTMDTVELLLLDFFWILP